MVTERTSFVGAPARNRAEWAVRLKAAAVHLLISIAIGVISAFGVFGLWYPYPYREISGGRELFLLLVTVDVLLGPLITFAIFNRRKPQKELHRDLMVVGLLQIGALCYGLWTVAVARPVHLVFEIDRFRVVHAVDVPDTLLSRAPEGVKPLPWTGPTTLAVRAFLSEQEKVDATLAALQGIDLGARPDLWQRYGEARPRVLAAARPVGELVHRFPSSAHEIRGALSALNRAVQDVTYLPVVGRKSFWTVLLDAKTGDVIGFLPLDSF